jgi:hypothetical protein
MKNQVDKDLNMIMIRHDQGRSKGWNLVTWDDVVRTGEMNAAGFPREVTYKGTAYKLTQSDSEFAHYSKQDTSK